MRTLNLTNYIMARYINKDEKMEMTSVDYVNAVRTLIDNGLLHDAMVFDTFEDIKEIVEICHSVEIIKLSTNVSDYITNDDGKGSIAAFNKVVFKLFEARQAFLKMDYIKMMKKQKDDFLATASFFGFIPLNYTSLPERFLTYLIREKFIGNELFLNMIEVNVEDKELKWADYDAPMQQTFLQMFTSALSINIRDINTSEIDNRVSVKRLRILKNKYDNHFQEVEVIGKSRNKNRPTSFKTLIPLCIKGVYSLGTTRFVLKKRAKDLFVRRATLLLRNHLYKIVGSSVAFSRFYELNKTNSAVIGDTIQENLLASFYSQVEVRPTDRDLKRIFWDVQFGSDQQAMDAYDKYERLNTFRWNYFVPIHAKDGGIDTLTKAEMYAELLKFYYPEYTTTDDSKGKDILDRKKAYERYKDIPFTFNGKYDPTIVNNKGDFVLARRKDGYTIAEELNPFVYYDKTGIRTYLGTYTMMHAFTIDGWEPSKPMTRVTEGLFQKNVPFYNIWYVYKSHRDSSGSLTTDGMFGFDKALKIYHGIKATLPGLEKGQSFIMNDRMFFMHKGKKIYLSAINPTNTTGRQNPSWQVEGMYHAKRLLDGKTDLIVRDVSVDPIKTSELLPMQQIFLESKGQTISLGKHPVGYNKTFFIKDVYSSDYEQEDIETSEMVFKPVKSILGTEFSSRATLLNSKEMLELMYGNEDHQEKMNEIIVRTMEDDSILKRFKKDGLIVKSFFKSRQASIISTVLANYKIKQNQVVVRLVEKDIKGFFRNLPTKLDVEAYKQRVLYGNEIYIDLTTMSLRNPSVNDANGISVYVTVKLAHPRAKFSYVEVHPLMWALQGGDFDGDLIGLLFMDKKYKSAIEKTYGLHNHTIVEGFEFKEQAPRSFDTLKEFYFYYAAIKKNSDYALEYINKIFKNKEFTVNSKEEFLNLSKRGTLTTMIGKGLIGVSKSITMKTMDYIEHFMQQYPDAFNDVSRKTLTTYCNVMNVEELAQPTIDIQKWSDDFKKVINMVLRSYYMNEAISLGIESQGLISFQTFAIIRDYMVKAKLLTPVVVRSNNFPTYTRYDIHRENLDLSQLDGYVRKMFDNDLVNIERFFTWQQTDKDFIEVFKYEQEPGYISNPQETVMKLIDIINPDGKVYNWVKETVAAKMEDFEKSEFSV